MKIIPGAIVGKISGSLGGMTASHGRGGYYLRNRVVPVNPNSAAQIEARNAFTYLTSAWRELSAGQREAWQVAADNTPRTDTLGEALVLTGQQAYVACNQPRLRAGLSVIDDAPLTLAGPALLVINPVAELNGTALDLDFQVDDTQADGNAIFQLSRPLPDTVSFFKGPFRFAGQAAFLAQDVTVTLASAATIAPPEAGQRLRYRLRPTYNDGRLGPVTEGWATITEP